LLQVEAAAQDEGVGILEGIEADGFVEVVERVAVIVPFKMDGAPAEACGPRTSTSPN
jgi:hypothetical protein